MTNKTVKKWPMNDFLIALEKLFEEHDSCLQVDPQGYIAAASGIYTRLDKAIDKTNIGNFINDSLRPENQIKEQKMEKQYKYVDAGIKTVGELVDRLMSGEKLYCDKELMIFDSSLKLNELLEKTVFEVMNLIIESITTRQPIPWYEQEGVFPCLVCAKGNHDFVYIVTGFDGVYLSSVSDGGLNPAYLKPLSPEQAEKYGVDV